jgi:hypothetical protein
MRRLAVCATAALIAGALLTGCGGSHPGTATPAAARQTATSTDISPQDLSNMEKTVDQADTAASQAAQSTSTDPH